MRLGDDDALARRRARRSSRRRGRAASRGTRAPAASWSASKAAWRGGRHAGVGEHLLHPRLRAFEPRGRGADGPNTAAPLRAQVVGQPVDQRLLGPDRRRARTSSRLCDRGRSSVEARRRSRPSPGCPARRRPRRPPASAASAHASACSRPPDPTTRTFTRAQAARGSTTVWSRAGPTDTKLTCTPVNSSMKRT